MVPQLFYMNGVETPYRVSSLITVQLSTVDTAGWVQ
jgi:hypothetical protein